MGFFGINSSPTGSRAATSDHSARRHFRSVPLGARRLQGCRTAKYTWCTVAVAFGIVSAVVQSCSNGPSKGERVKEDVEQSIGWGEIRARAVYVLRNVSNRTEQLDMSVWPEALQKRITGSHIEKGRGGMEYVRIDIGRRDAIVVGDKGFSLTNTYLSMVGKEVYPGIWMVSN